MKAVNIEKERWVCTWEDLRGTYVVMQNSKQGRGSVGVDEAAGVCFSEVLISLFVRPVILPHLESPCDFTAEITVSLSVLHRF